MWEKKRVKISWIEHLCSIGERSTKMFSDIPVRKNSPFALKPFFTKVSQRPDLLETVSQKGKGALGIR